MAGRGSPGAFARCRVAPFLATGLEPQSLVRPVLLFPEGELKHLGYVKEPLELENAVTGGCEVQRLLIIWVLAQWVKGMPVCHMHRAPASCPSVEGAGT